MTDDAAHRGTSGIAEISSTLDDFTSISEEPCATSGAQNCESEDAARIFARLPGRSIGWMALCLEA
jgi:hypothetical protein